MFFFFFQAEDGIRDRDVTGVQTCALPIYVQEPDNRTKLVVKDRITRAIPEPNVPAGGPSRWSAGRPAAPAFDRRRSEERRVGKGCRPGVARCHEKKKGDCS